MQFNLHLKVRSPLMGFMLVWALSPMGVSGQVTHTQQASPHSAPASSLAAQQAGQASAANPYLGNAPAQPSQQGAAPTSQAGKPFTFSPVQPSVPMQNPAAGNVAASPYQNMQLPPPPNWVQMGLDMTAPMTAAQVREMMEEMLRRQRAARENFTDRPAPKPTTSVQTLDLSPGAVPPVVRVGVGQGTVLSFADAAGRPWEVVDNLNFHGDAFDVKLIAPHLYTIALKQPASANIAIVLKDLPRPIVVTAVPAQDEVDYLVEFTVPKFLGGMPPASAMASAANAGPANYNSESLLNYLYRTPPPEAKPLQVEGMNDVLAWQSSPSTMVIRTDGLLMLPAWLRRHVSTDGVGVYEVPLSPVASIARNGQVIRVSLSGFMVTAQSAIKSAAQTAVSGGQK